MLTQSGSARPMVPSEILRMAHDIRSPLSALNIVLDGLVLSGPKRQLIRHALHRINDIANDLVRYEKHSHSGNADQTIYIAPTETIRALVVEKRLQYQNHCEIEITSDLRGAYGRFAAISPGDLARTLSNLIDNAVEACPSAGWVHVSMEATDTSLSIQVEDNGIGMDREILAGLGRRGFSVGKEDGTAGMGLGVYSARRSVEKCGGSLNVESCVGRGSVFTLTLPCVPPPPWWPSKIEVRPKQIVLNLVGAPAPEVRKLQNRFELVGSVTSAIRCRDEVEMVRQALHHVNSICVLDATVFDQPNFEVFAREIKAARAQVLVLVPDGEETSFGRIAAVLNAKIVTRSGIPQLPVSLVVPAESVP